MTRSAFVENYEQASIGVHFLEDSFEENLLGVLDELSEEEVDEVLEIGLRDSKVELEEGVTCLLSSRQRDAQQRFENAKKILTTVVQVSIRRRRILVRIQSHFLSARTSLLKFRTVVSIDVREEEFDDAITALKRGLACLRSNRMPDSLGSLREFYQGRISFLPGMVRSLSLAACDQGEYLKAYNLCLFAGDVQRSFALLRRDIRPQLSQLDLVEDRPINIPSGLAGHSLVIVRIPERFLLFIPGAGDRPEYWFEFTTDRPQYLVQYCSEVVLDELSRVARSMRTSYETLSDEWIRMGLTTRLTMKCMTMVRAMWLTMRLEMRRIPAFYDWLHTRLRSDRALADDLPEDVWNALTEPSSIKELANCKGAAWRAEFPRRIRLMLAQQDIAQLTQTEAELMAPHSTAVFAQGAVHCAD